RMVGRLFREVGNYFLWISLGYAEERLMKRLAWMLMLSWLILPCPELWARGERVPGSRYTSARAAAMGDAFLPLADDAAAALFYNPAGLGKIRGNWFEPLNLQLQANSGYFSNVSLDFYKVLSLNSYAPVLAE